MNEMKYLVGVVKHDPQDISAVQFLAMWHLERQSYQQVRILFFLYIYKCNDKPFDDICHSLTLILIPSFLPGS